MFTGDHDERDAICEVHSGAGGTDAQDWADMMLRMYTRWAQQEGFEVELDERSEGTEAGISSATFIVKGRYAYGMLHGEQGVHRLIRISPFDANAPARPRSRRSTPFPRSNRKKRRRSTSTTSASTPTGRRARAVST